jgi:hypothetical protein
MTPRILPQQHTIGLDALKQDNPSVATSEDLQSWPPFQDSRFQLQSSLGLASLTAMMGSRGGEVKINNNNNDNKKVGDVA